MYTQFRIERANTQSETNLYGRGHVMIPLHAPIVGMIAGLVPKVAVTLAQLPPDSVGSQVAEWGSITVVSTSFLYFIWAFANNRIVSRDSERAEEAARSLAAKAQAQTDRAQALAADALEAQRAAQAANDRLMSWLEGRL